MQASGIKANQVTQVRGFADQRLRKPDAPLDPANRRISLIVQYIIRDHDDDDAKPSAGSEPKLEGAKPVSANEKPAAKTRSHLINCGKGMVSAVPATGAARTA